MPAARAPFGLELANRGHFVHGIDISPEMIQIAKAKSMRLPNVYFEVQDMTQFSVEGKFDLVTCTFDSINYVLDAHDVRKMLERVAGALRISAMFVFDSNTDRLYSNVRQEAQERELCGKSFVQKLSYEGTKREATIVFEFEDGTTEVHKQRPYDLAELEPILATAGLRVVQAFSDFDKKPYDSESARLICIAQRAAKGDGV